MAGFGWVVWLVVGLAAGAAWLAWNRRRTLRRARPCGNMPIVTQGPVRDPHLFVGRSRLEERLLQTLANNSLLLLGEPRIGKSSLLWHLRHRMLKEELPRVSFFPVLIDLDGVTEAGFFSSLRKAVLEQLWEVVGEEELPSGSWHRQQSYGARQLAHDLQHLLRSLGRLTTNQVRLVLLIDRADLLNEFDPRINQQLRGLFMRSFGANLAAVLAGVEVRRNWEREGSPWFNFLEEVELGPLTPEEARRLVNLLLEGRVSIERQAVERLVLLSGCRPHRIQCMARLILERHGGSGSVKPADVDSAASLLREHPSG